MNRLIRSTPIVFLVLVIVGCNTPVQDKLIQADLPRIRSSSITNEQASLIRNGVNRFAIDLYQRITLENDSNVIFSPYSIWMAFSMVYAGSQGETESQMLSVFHYLSQESQHIALNALDQRLQTIDKPNTDEDGGTPFQLELANGAWSQKGYAFNQSYLNLLATQYGAGIHVVDFENSSEAAREEINSWVGEKTNGRIKDIAGPGSISSDTRFLLINAILFKAGWMNKFDQTVTANGPFTLLDGSEVNTPFMHVTAALDYLENANYQAVRLPYVGYKTEMWLILPTPGNWDTVKAELGTIMLNDIQKQAGMAQITLAMPSFNFESSLLLNDLLISMGLTQAFCPEGNYNGISEGGGLCIGQAMHKAMIKVDEQGTEATAATMIVMPVSIMPVVKLSVDRPFIYTIVDQESGLMLFLGQVLNPAVH